MFDEKIDRFKRQLDENHEWPCTYKFKFIVPKEQVVVLCNIISIDHSKLVPSRNGNFVSVNFEMTANSADEIVAIYQSVSKIKGLISL